MTYTPPLILGFDTSGPYCASAVLSDDLAISEKFEPMKRGQAERLMPQLEETLFDAGKTWNDLNAIGVGIGPGNFTGIRISVSAARGLALALEIPVVGVSMFDVVASIDPELGSRVIGPGASTLVSLPAPRDQAYVQKLSNGQKQGSPQLIDPENPPRDLQMSFGMAVVGHRAEEIGRHFEAISENIEPNHIAARIAELAWIRIHKKKDLERPAPLYVKAADAAPSRTPAPTILT